MVQTMRLTTHIFGALPLVFAISLASLSSAPALAQGAEKTREPQTTISISARDRTRAQDGLIGPVRRVRTETASYKTVGGKQVEGPRRLLEMVAYDIQGNRVDSAYYSVEGKPVTGREEYKYDGRGNIIEMSLRNEYGHLLVKEYYSYEYDPVGNWTKMVTAVAVVDGDTISLEPVEVTYRNITYYLDESISRRLQETLAQRLKAGSSLQIDPASTVVASGQSAPDSSRLALKDAAPSTPVSGSSAGGAQTSAARTAPVADAEPVVDTEPDRLKPAPPVIEGAGESAPGSTAGLNLSRIAQAEEHYAQGIELYEAGQYKDAVEEFKKSIRLKPQSPNAYNELGITYAELGQYKEAIKAFKQAIRLNPKNASGYSNLGLAYYRAGKFKEAIEPFQQALRLAPDNAVVHDNLGLAYSACGQYDEAVNSFKQAINLKPGNADAHFNLGLVYLALGDGGMALEQQRMLGPLDPEQADRLAREISEIFSQILSNTHASGQFGISIKAND